MTLQDVRRDFDKGLQAKVYQTDEMQPPVPILRSLAAGHDVFGLVELPLLDGDIDPDDVLPDYAARTDIQMSVETRI